MAVTSLGRITATAGTPVRITNNDAVPSSRVAAHAITIQALPTNTDYVYIGLSTVDPATFTGVVHVLAVPSGQSIPSFSLGNPMSMNALDASLIWIDVGTTGEGVIAAYETT